MAPAAIVGTPGIRGLVAEHVRVSSGYEAAIAAALGTLADAVLADDHDAAVAALARARDSDAGRVEIVVADAAAAPALGSLPAGIAAATDFVTAPAGVLGILSHVVVADDLEAAPRRLARAAENRRAHGHHARGRRAHRVRAARGEPAQSAPGSNWSPNATPPPRG
ncbi:MAG: hypothetical protein WDM88_01515 [Galbitalea sp.]